MADNELLVHGNGMMASRMRLLSNIRAGIFAAGVSNSNETRKIEFDREITELMNFIKYNRERKLIYFSSYVASDKISPYAEHKRMVEKMIRDNTNDYIIVRLPQVVGLTNNKTLVNYLINAMATGRKIILQKKAFRSLIDVVDVARILELLIQKKITNEMIPIGPLRPMSILDIVNYIELNLEMKLDYDLIDEGETQRADLSRLVAIIGKMDRVFNDGYQSMVLQKYAHTLFRENLGD